MIGYSQDAKAYRCYHWPTHRVITSFNVKFIESKDTTSRPLQPGCIVPAITTIHGDPTPDSRVEIIHPTQQPSLPGSVYQTPLTSPINSPNISPAPSCRASVSGELELQHLPVSSNDDLFPPEEFGQEPR